MISGKFSSTEVIFLIKEAFNGEDEPIKIYDLRGSDAQEFIDVVNEVQLVFIRPSGPV